MWRYLSVTAAQAAFVLEPTSVSHAVVLLYFRSAVVRLSFRFDVVLFSVIALLWLLALLWCSAVFRYLVNSLSSSDCIRQAILF